MQPYSSLADDFYVTMNLNTEMDLPQNRETVLGFFERLQKSYPTMRNFYSLEKGDFVLEEDKERGHYRRVTLEHRRITSCQVNATALDDAIAQHRLVLELAPYMLSLSPLDCECIDLMFGFDFNYRGNQNQLIAEALGISPALEKLAETSGATVINYEPTITLALDEGCRLQCRLSVETRTSAFHIRTGEFPEEQVSVYFTARQYGSLGADTTYEKALDRLRNICQEMVDSYVIENVLEPLMRVISTKQ